MPARAFIRPEHLTALVHDTFGTDRRLTGMRRIQGGTKKGVYRLTLDDATTAVLYIWHPDENYWPASNDGFGDPMGLDAYVACRDAYLAAGVRVAATHLADRSHRHYPADLALVEDLPNGTLQDLLERDAEAARPALEQLREELARMRASERATHGLVAQLAAGVAAQDRRPEEIALSDGLRDLAEAAGVVPEVAAVQDRAADLIRAAAATIVPRTSYSLVHGELGADHVMLDRDGRPVLVDIEGTGYHDAEMEHFFVRMRFGDAAYAHLRPNDLDPDRLRLYELVRVVSLIAGPMRMVDGDFPDRDFMRQIAGWNTESLLRIVSETESH
jgi:hypothetical protein